MLYKLEHGKDVFELNPELKAIEEFARLTDRQMTYVILATDYKTPFRKLNTESKKYQAAITAGYKLEKDGKRLDFNGRNLVEGKVGNVEAAVKKYKEIQRDEDYETLLSVSALIAQIRDLNFKEDKTALELEKAAKMTLGLDKLVQTKKNIESILDMREEAVTPLVQEDDTVDTDNMSILAQLNEEM